MSIFVKVLGPFLSREKESFQSKVIEAKRTENTNYADIKKDYLDFCRVVEKSRYKNKPLSLKEILYLARHYRSYKNEVSGKTVKYHV